MYTWHNMPRASRKPINKELIIELKSSFISLISLLNNSADIESFLKDFLTKEEDIMLTKRLMMHVMLHNNHASSQIEASLGVSRETVRTHKQVFERGGQTYKNVVRKIAQKQNLKQLWKKISKALKPADLFLQSITNMKARAKFASGDWQD